VLTIRTSGCGQRFFGASCLAVSSSHWLKNWIFYGDPFYPLLHKYLAARPFYEGLDRCWIANTGMPGSCSRAPLDRRCCRPSRPSDVLLHSHDWGFHGDRPVFGSLFTLLIPVLAFFRARQRLWLMIAGIISPLWCGS